MIINFNTITSNFNRTKIALTAGAYQGSLQALRACRATAYIADLALRKAVKTPFLLKKIFSKKDIIKDSSSPAQQEVILDPLQSPNPLIQDISESFKKTVFLYKSFTNKSGSLAEKAVNQVGHLLETINKKPSVENIPSLDRVDFGKLLDSPLRVTQGFFPKEFLNLTGRNESEKEITTELKSLVACLQRLKIPCELSETFTPSGIDSINKQLKLINKGIEAFKEKEANHPANVCRMLINAHSSISKLQILLEKYQKDLNRPIAEEDRIFVKNTIKNNPLVTKVVSPTVIALGSVATPFITIDCAPYIASNAIDLLTNAVHVFQENAFPVLQNATITTASCALAAVSYTGEEEQESIPRYMINALANQVLTCAFAYVGARMCGSKTKVKKFVEQRISSVLAYKTCNYNLDSLGISFWYNKVCSSTVSSCANHLLNLFTEENPSE